MRLPRIILAATDFSPLAAVAVESAFALARRTNARVHVVHVLSPVVPAYPPEMGGLMAEQVFEARRAEATTKLDAIGETGVETTRELRFGSPAKELLAAASSVHADLLVIATHGHGLAARILLGSVAASLIRTSTVPVLVVGAARTTHDLDTVVAAVDLSAVSKQVVDAARSFVATDGELDVVAFVARPESAWLRQRYESELAALVPKTVGPETHLQVLERDSAADGIIEVAESLEADMVVLGTSGHSAWQRAFLGSTATRVLAKAPCPVLVIPVG